MPVCSKIQIAFLRRIFATTGWICVALLILCPTVLLGATGSEPAATTLSRGESRNVFGYDSTPDFVAFDSQYRQKHAQYADELRELQLELARQAAQGRATPCSRQIFLEARWLVHYSAHWE